MDAQTTMQPQETKERDASNKQNRGALSAPAIQPFLFSRQPFPLNVTLNVMLNVM
jgi:hypothetical protein